MRIELIYSPGCASYKQALHALESVIAEERLPLHVELVERTSGDGGSGSIYIDGIELDALENAPQGPVCKLYKTASGFASAPCFEYLREIVFRKWKEITEKPLLRASWGT